MQIAIGTLASRFWEGLLDLIFPVQCIICGKAQENPLCSDCVSQIQFIKPPFCRKCGKPLETSSRTQCECSMVEYHFDTARSVGLYEGILKEAIHVLKYRKHVALANPLGKIMADQLPKLLPANQTNQIDVIIPVPIHRSKLLDRGFNQAEELARRVSQLTRVPIETKTLVKIKITPDQVGLPREQRAENLLGAFAVTDITKVAGKKILLVDDVFTTGATLSEAAKVLRANGAYQINSYSLARGM